MLVRARRFVTGITVLLLSGMTSGQESIIPVISSSPHVVFSLTNERDIDDTSFFSIPSSRPGGEALPTEGQQIHYEVATFDTGAPATIIGRDAYEGFDIAGAGKEGLNVTPVGGVGAAVDAINSDPLGVYAAGFDAVLIKEEPIFVDRTLMKGTFNDSILYASAGADLPNLIGTTTSSHYTTTINAGDPQIFTLRGDTYRSPSAELHTLGSVTKPSRRVGLTIVPGALGAPAYLPDLANLDFDDLSNNPSTPTVAGSFFLRANVKNNGVERNQLEMILDTGAQGTIVSDQIAAEMGFDVANDDPDFVVRIAGVTGIAEAVPGFYADEFVLPGTDGGLVLHDVPLIVFNLTDPRDGVNTLPGLIGMNIFWDRDLILNPEPGGAYLGISDRAVDDRYWASSAASTTWLDAANWSDPGVPEVTWNAVVGNVSGSPQVATVESDSSVGHLRLTGGDTAEALMSLQIQSETTLEVYGSAIISDGATLDMQGGTLDPVAVELRGGEISGNGDIGGEVLSQGTLTPGGTGGIGLLNFTGSFDQLADGVLRIDIANADDYDRITADGDISLSGLLEVELGEGYVSPGSGESDQFTIVSANRIFDSFDEVVFDGVELIKEVQLGADERAFVDHLGSGLFVGLSFTESEVSLQNYQAIPGDADGNGEVSFADFLALNDAFGQAGMEWVNGEFTGDGLVQFADFLLLADNFGTPATAAAIPEPSSAMLLVFSAALLLQVSRRRLRGKH